MVLLRKKIEAANNSNIKGSLDTLKQKCKRKVEGKAIAFKENIQSPFKGHFTKILDSFRTFNGKLLNIKAFGNKRFGGQIPTLSAAASNRGLIVPCVKSMISPYKFQKFNHPFGLSQ